MREKFAQKKLAQSVKSDQLKNKKTNKINNETNDLPVSNKKERKRQPLLELQYIQMNSY